MGTRTQFRPAPVYMDGLVSVREGGKKGGKTTDLLFPQCPARSIQREGKELVSTRSGRQKRQTETKTTYNERLIMRFQLLQPPTCRISSHQRAKRKLIHCACIFLVIRWRDEWFHDQPPPKVNPIDTVFTPCPRRVERGRPGIWAGVVAEWVCRVRYPCMGAGGC